MAYKRVLTNEVLVTRKNIEKIFAEKEVFVLGYGSLLYSSGWFGRGMHFPPLRKELKECTVTGYERGTYGLYNFPTAKALFFEPGIHFYGVVENTDCNLNGVLAKIFSALDWEYLMYTECIAGITLNYNYRVVDITANIRGVKLKKNQVVHMVVNELKNKSNWKDYMPSPQYYNRVATGVKKERSKNFQRMFHATGGLDHTKSKELYKKAKTMYY